MSPMLPQPAGTTRSRMGAVETDLETGKPLPAGAFEIVFRDSDHGQIKIGETHRLKDGKRRGQWEARTVVPRKFLKGLEDRLDPFKRHNDAIAHLLVMWDYAKGRGWVPKGAQQPQGDPMTDPVTKDETAAALLPVAVSGTDEGHLAEDEAAIGVAIESPPEPELPEMEGVPVMPVPPEVAAQVLSLPAEPAKSEGISAHETEEIVRVIPAGHPDDPSVKDGSVPLASPEPEREVAAALFQAATAPGEPIILHMQEEPLPPRPPQEFNRIPTHIPRADPQVQAEVVQADDWLSQPAVPPPPPLFSDAGAFPLGFPESDDRNPVE